MTESISVFLTSAQRNKLNGGKTFQLSAHQLGATSGKHHVEIQMTPKNHKELLRSVAKGKGYRFTKAKIEGSGIFGNIAKGIAKAAAPLALDFIGDKTGQKGITDALKGSTDGVIDAVSNQVSGGKLVKGSPAMKAHMAKLRSMRKVKGGNIFDDLGRKIKDGFNKTFTPALGNQISSALTSPIAKQVYSGIADAGATALTGDPMAGALAGQAVSTLAGSGLKRRYKKRNIMVVGGTLVGGVPTVQVRMNHVMTPLSGGRLRGGRVKGGSFLSP